MPSFFGASVCPVSAATAGSASGSFAVAVTSFVDALRVDHLDDERLPVVLPAEFDGRGEDLQRGRRDRGAGDRE